MALLLQVHPASCLRYLNTRLLSRNTQVTSLSTQLRRHNTGPRPTISSPVVAWQKPSNRHLTSSNLLRWGQGLEEVRWLQLADSTTVMMEAAHIQGIHHYSVCLSFTTAKPLPQEDVVRALTHLYWKVPPLRTCLRRRDGQLWLCEMVTPKIDFKEVECVDMAKEVTDLLNCVFDNSADGPLWRARLLLGASDLPGLQDSIRSSLPYHYHCMISFHHGVVDGMSSHYVFKTLIELLESVIRGTPVDDAEQVGIMGNDEQTIRLEQEIKEELQKDPQRLNMLVEQLSSSNFVPLLTQAVGDPSDRELCTRHLVSNLKPSAMEKFVKACKSNGVSVYSGLTAVINTAIVEVAREAGLKRDSYSVTSSHAVNLRQYWELDEPDPNWVFGCHAHRFSYTSEVPYNNQQIFWDYVKQTNKEMKKMIQNKEVLIQKVVSDLVHGKDFDYEALFATPLPVTGDYFLTYPYSPYTHLGAEEHLQFNQLTPFRFVHKDPIPNQHVFSSFRGTIMYIFYYSAWHTEDEVARKLQNRITSLITTVAK